MRILGVGSALPEKVVTNEDLTKFLDTSDEWIRTRTGIQSRRVISSESLLSLGALAGQRALESAGVDASEIDYLICTTVQGDMVTPGLGCLLTGALGVSSGSVDLNGACAGFVYALDMADAYIASGKAKKILIVSAEANSRLCDWSDRSTAVLFGDGAGATVVGEGDGYIAGLLTNQANAEVLVFWPEPGNSPFAGEHPFTPLHMDGQAVYKFAVSAVGQDINALLARAAMTPDDVDLFVLHQANQRILDAAQQRLKQPPEKFPHNIERTGNTSSASIPILLDELMQAGQLKPGMTLALSAFGAGLTTGACLLRWTKD